MSDPKERIAASIAAAESLAPAAPRVGGEDSPSPEAGDDFDGGAGGPPPDDVDWDALRACAGFEQNDVGNSLRLRLRHGDDILHVQNVGFFAWDGRRWREDVDQVRLRPMCHATVSMIALEAFVLPMTEAEEAAVAAGEAAVAAIEEARQRLMALDDDDALSKKARDRRKAEIKAEMDGLKEAVRDAALARKAHGRRRVARRGFGVASGNTGKIDGMQTEALSFLSRPVTDMDADKLALNLGNGTLHFSVIEAEDPDDPGDSAPNLKRTAHVALRPHARADLITKLAEADYRPKAECPQFAAFLARILPQADVREFVQRFFGYCLTGLDVEQVFVMLHGDGRNGKSTLVDIMARIMGDYSASVPVATLVNSGDMRKGSEATPELARLPGARLVRSAEPKEGLPLDEAMIKQLTSREPISIRRLHKEFIDVYPGFKIVISVNRKPDIRGNDDAIWRRVILIPFDVQIPVDEVDKGMADKLWAERDGILAWAIAGCLDYLARGRLDPPAAVQAATADYREESDTVGGFVRAALIVTQDPADTVETGLLHAAFEVYCRRQGATPLSAKTFTRRMPKAAAKGGFIKGKHSISTYEGIRLRGEFLPKDKPAQSDLLQGERRE